ncbi:XdhC family protein [Desulfosporosinus metallidurans]|uniref:Xanthine and CO dehydrogenases maturation factor, XdhC/CoxF family n=1 Tax=Desulfosporosinus metallidurans TaxID=1888891 RepID=A0A1Q8QZG4_9FIRM|nr:XdhC family protein [Desulfosporosinus metallidurans]OLN32691.1 Xanthine and CO dehydrogenases maturation factor, XdhC/CoxF family [Desulfosporosinus metallidurans]
MQMIEFYAALNRWVNDNRLGVTGTIVSGKLSKCPVGSKFLTDENGQDVLGQIDAELMTLLEESIQDVLRIKTPKLIELEFLNESVKVFLDPILPQARLLILGGGHIAVPLAEMGKLLEFQVSVVDDRPSFANSARFQQVSQVLCQDFETAIREFEFDANTYIIIVTRGHRHDKTCLAEVLKKTKPAYIGMIGSRRKVAALFEDLREDGFSEAELKSVHAPIGLDIGAQTPAEISVSIMAEIIMIRRFGYSSGLKTQGGKRNG